MKALRFLYLILWLYPGNLWAQGGIIMTVNGPIAPSDMGFSLVHEHVLVDFIGADSTGYHRWNRPEVIQVALPYLKEIKKWGVQTFVECTPAYIGRDPLLLKELSQSTKINFITKTGYYGAAGN